MSDDLIAEGEAVLAAATPEMRALVERFRDVDVDLTLADTDAMVDALLAAYRDRERLAEERTRLRTVQADLTKRINHSADVCANEENRRRDAERETERLRAAIDKAMDAPTWERSYVILDAALAASRESPGYVTTLPTGQRVEIGGVARESQTEERADG